MLEFDASFVSKRFLYSIWSHDFESFKDTPQERELLERLQRWADRPQLNEIAAQAAFLEEFFRATWGYVQAGQADAENHFTLRPAFPVVGAGARGGMGSADAALGYFTANDPSPVPQVLVEFKDISSSLDAPQRRKGNARSPVKQGLDYLYSARRGMFGHEPIIPTWAIVTDMNEFRLYWADRGERQYVRFVIRQSHLFQGESLLAEDENSRFDRFLFLRLFQRDLLIVRGTSGRAALLDIIRSQGFRQRDLENRFYSEYRGYREHLYETLLAHNGPDTDRFPGTRGRLVRLAQKLLDRCIFVFFCEDMGRALGFPPQLLRDYLARQSGDQYFDPQGQEAWQWLRRLFTAMNEGRAFGDHNINQFNGGLFALDPELDCLHIPNSVFYGRGQGQNEASLAANPLTLLYLCGSYNYAAGLSVTAPRAAAAPQRDPERSIGLYTLGRIFEQSITELEILEAEADGRVSVNKESKRKRDGVFYTPEWIVERIVDETIGRRMSAMKLVAGWPEEAQEHLPTIAAVDLYENALREMKIVDPACGSGAFLITALRYLVDEWRMLQQLRREIDPRGHKLAREEAWTDATIREVLSRNLYGVDINPASVEITKLALWLHTARADRPLSNLDNHIRDGNSLIGPEFYDGLAPYNDDERERVNAFNWQTSFPEVFERGGFDAVVGNPPYVKLQNFRRVHADMAAFLMRGPGGGGRYYSTQTGSFDLYLPFIEKGIELLNEDGQLGYSAPSVWAVTEYGEGLRQFIQERGHLWGWIDFGSHQIFEEATVYTALQFYSRRPNDSIAIVKAPTGVIAESPWLAENITLPYERLNFAGRWLLATGRERDLVDRLAQNSSILNNRELTTGIHQGLITSADHIYHLKRLSPGRYEEKPEKRAGRGRIVEIEDAIMKPLVSGPEAKRYILPETETYLLFPYAVDGGQATLKSAAEIQFSYPLAWAYLRGHELELRSRENGAFDDEQWWRFGRTQNLARQETPKLIVAQTVRRMQVAADIEGQFYLNNVRVNAIAAAPDVSPWYLLAALNCNCCNFFFTRTAKPKDGSFFEANKQFIAPLPIPNASANEKAELARLGQLLQELYTGRRDLLADLARRLDVVRARPRPETWLFPELLTIEDLLETAPARLQGGDRQEWAKQRFAASLQSRLVAIEEHLKPGAALAAELVRGELRFLIDGVVVIQGVFLAPEEAAFVLAQWAVFASRFDVTERTDGKKLANELRRVSLTAEPALVKQIIDLQRELSRIEGEIAEHENTINLMVYRLYDLTPSEIRLIEQPTV